MVFTLVIVVVKKRLSLLNGGVVNMKQIFNAYAVAKVQKDNIFTAFTGGSNSYIEFIKDAVYTEYRHAVNYIEEQQTILDEDTDKKFNKLSPEEQQEILKALEEPDTVYQQDMYFVIPISEIITIKSVPSALTKKG
jgi:hypothetical protein